MKSKAFKIYILLTSWCFCFDLHAHIPYTDQEDLPSQHLERASHSIWKLWSFYTSDPGETQRESKPFQGGGIFEGLSYSQGTGFFIAPEDPEQKFSNHLITNCHVILGLLRDNKDFTNINITNAYHPEWETKGFAYFAINKIVALDCSLDMALLETNHTSPFYLTIEDTPVTREEELFILGYPGDTRHLIRKIGPLNQKFPRHEFPTDHSHLNGTSGSPLMDIQGRFRGMVFSGRGNFMRSVSGRHVKDFIEGKRGVRCENSELEKCLKEALALLHKEVNSDYPPALFQLAQMYYKGRIEEQDVKKTFNLVKRLADQGDAASQLSLARMCFTGEGVEKDIPCAIDYAKRSVEQGYAPAMVFLAVFLLNHVGKEIKEWDGETAFDLVRNSAEKGFTPAQLFLGHMCFTGEGVEKNIPCAVDWIGRSANYGYVPAQAAFGELYFTGEGVEKDIQQAIYWWQIARMQNNNDARYNLAQLYLVGEGVEQDRDRAFDDLEFLADQGYAPAIDFLANLDPLMQVYRELRNIQKILPRQ